MLVNEGYSYIVGGDRARYRHDGSLRSPEEIPVDVICCFSSIRMLAQADITCAFLGSE